MEDNAEHFANLKDLKALQIINLRGDITNLQRALEQLTARVDKMDLDIIALDQIYLRDTSVKELEARVAKLENEPRKTCYVYDDGRDP